MGQLIFGKPVTIQGQKFDNVKLQASKEGVPRPIVFGKARPIVGNVIAASVPRIVEKRERQGGKGAPKTTVVSEEIYRTYAIRICEGPVNGVTRVWNNGEIIYDAGSQEAAQLENNAVFLEIAEFFTGSFDQHPSAVLQGAFGINEVSAYRGTCYMVIDDQNLTDSGGTIPQYQFEVERCVGSYLTSKPYPIYHSDSIGQNISTDSIINRDQPVYSNLESFDLALNVSQIDLKEALIPYSFDEAFDISASVNNIDLFSPLIEYSNEEALDISLNVTLISHPDVLISYTNADEEALELAATVISINLT